MVLAVLIVFLALKPKSEESTAHNSQHIIFKFGAREMPTFEKPQLVYAVTKEEALVAVNQKIYFAEDYLYASKVSDIIKIFENDEYSTMFCLSDKNSKEGAFVAAKFSIKTVDSKKQYALIDIMRQGYGNSRKSEVTPEKSLSIFCQYIFDMANLSNFGIVEGN